MIYGQQSFLKKSTDRANKAYAEAVITDGGGVIVVWDMVCARSIRDEQLRYNYRHFCDVYGLRSAHALSSREAKRAMKRGVRVIAIK